MRRSLRHNIGTLRSIRRSEFHRPGRESHLHSTNRTWVRTILHPELLCVKHQPDGALTNFAMRVAMGRFLVGRLTGSNRPPASKTPYRNLRLTGPPNSFGARAACSIIESSHGS